MLFNVPLAKYTSYKVGGCAKIYCRPKNTEQLVDFITSLPKQESIVWLGLGSNVLIRDGGIDAAVIHSLNVLNSIDIIEKTNEHIVIKVGAGLTCSKLAKFCIEHGLVAGIWFAGIPGTIGGALAMNAGAFGGETWNHVLAVEVINRQGEITKHCKNDYKIGYREVIKNTGATSSPEWFIAGILYFNINDSKPTILQQQVELLLQKRKTTQPIGTLNCGSVFKNPQNNWAAKLIESSKLKGESIGGAIVSDKHANFIINLGHATAQDIETLIYLVRDKVLAKHNILLDMEVKIIGKPK